MRLGSLFGIPLKLSPLSLPMMALAVWLGEGERLSVMMGSILLHELAHVAAAKALHVRVLEMELMPVGGAARLENLWRLRPGQAALVALAGPTCNLLLMAAAVGMQRCGLIGLDWAARAVEQNAVILAFNLLPALPMDGGRVLCGLIGRRMTPSAAAKVGAGISCGVAAALLVLSVYGLNRRRLNITLPMAAFFLMVSAGREMRQSEGAAIESMAGRAFEMEEEGLLPVRWLAVGEETTARRAATRLRPRYMHMIAVFDRAMKPLGVVSEEALFNALVRDGDAKMGELSRNVKTKIF